MKLGKLITFASVKLYGLITHCAYFFWFISFIVSVQVCMFPLNMWNTIIYAAQWWKKYLLKRTLEFRIDGIPRLLIIPFFATLTNLIQHSLFINCGEFCQSPLLFQTPCLVMCTVNSSNVKPAQSHKTV